MGTVRERVGDEGHSGRLPARLRAGWAVRPANSLQSAHTARRATAGRTEIARAYPTWLRDRWESPFVNRTVRVKPTRRGSRPPRKYENCEIIFTKIGAQGFPPPDIVNGRQRSLMDSPQYAFWYE